MAAPPDAIMYQAGPAQPAIWQQGGCTFFGEQQKAPAPAPGGYHYEYSQNGSMILIANQPEQRKPQGPVMYERGGTVFFKHDQGPRGGTKPANEKPKMTLADDVPIIDEDGARCTLTVDGDHLSLRIHPRGGAQPSPAVRAVRDVKCYDDTQHIRFICQRPAPDWHVQIAPADWAHTRRSVEALRRSVKP
eukprot:TRINITY_DN19132_c0_g1_i1.p3 TRINITY_DN19132_c0_g1~~TRINITY_DN19132_c0_g1_i1.p3  ORF type:complete len:190 (+),score=51.87 TRINITY_DN19132_c0_g1_i1:110-679(+)